MLNVARKAALEGLNILVIEDQWLEAASLEQACRQEGANILGSVPTVAQALGVVSQSDNLDAVILDINLQGEMSYPVADVLARKGIPFVFSTGYGVEQIPAQYKSIPCCVKPIDPAKVADILARHALDVKPHRGPVVASAVQSNLLLAGLEPELAQVIADAGEECELPSGASLEVKGTRAGYCTFLTSGVASMRIADSARENVEVAMIGREGMVCASAVLHDASSATHTLMNVEGAGLRVPVQALSQLAAEHRDIELMLQRSALQLMDQMARTVLATGRYAIEERVARWLVMLSDRLGDSHLPVTHEMISWMLGVRRPGVTAALRTLGDAGCVRTERGAIVLLDRPKLVKASAGCYDEPPMRAIA